MGFVNNFCSCPSDCSTSLMLPALPVDPYCNTRPTQSEVRLALILPVGVTPPVDVTDVGQWEGVIANDNVDNTKGKYLVGIGSLEAPEKTVTRVAKGIDVTTQKVYTLSMQITSLPDATYDFLRAFQCNPRDFTFWFYDVHGYLYGGANGISPKLTDVDFVHNSGEESVLSANLNIQFRTPGCDPDRHLVPNLDANFSNLTTTFSIAGLDATTVFGTSATNIFTL